MAKKTDVNAGESALGDFAEELGAFLGNTERKASAWLSQRKTVAAQLTAIRDKASTLLAQLGASHTEAPKTTAKHVGSAVPASATRANAASVTRNNAASRTSKRVISAETRAKMADAARRRWAAKSQGGNR